MSSGTIILLLAAGLIIGEFIPCKPKPPSEKPVGHLPLLMVLLFMASLAAILIAS